LAGWLNFSAMTAPDVKEWANLIFRWVHVFAGIMWVGTTYYFTWLDGRFTNLEAVLSKGEDAKAEKNIWMVHSGGFYRVEKLKAPNVLPEKLHWFRWEAALTWLSGLLLFILVYYHGALMTPFEEQLTIPGTHVAVTGKLAVGMSVGLLIVGWAVYDLLWGKVFRNEMVGAVISYALIVATAWFLFQCYPARAACLQLGAMLGTIMTANVWMRILPPQRRMVAALKAGTEPSQVEAKGAKARSKHNTFIVIPVVFLMLSNHYPGAYDWRIVSVLVLLGWIAAKFIRRA
jgi:uncharacterized membrane protein